MNKIGLIIFIAILLLLSFSTYDSAINFESLLLKDKDSLIISLIIKSISFGVLLSFGYKMLYVRKGIS